MYTPQAKKVFKHMNHKKCIYCNNLNIIKKGIQGKYQRYYCKDCKKKFQSNRKAPPVMEELFYSFAFHKQTLKELSTSYHIRHREVQRAIDEFILPTIVYSGGVIYIQVDATYFGSKENKFCVILFRDYLSKKNLWWKFSKEENKSTYMEGKLFLESKGYIIKGVVADGLPLIRAVFKGIPFQMCQVHMERIVIKGTTRKPKLEAGQTLYAIIRRIHKMNSKTFKYYMNKYTLRYFHFLNQITINEETGERWYTHERIREAYLSLQHLQDYLFTFELDSNISRNTNSIEGTFTHVKNKLKAHNGLSPKRKKKIISILLHYGSGVEDYLK